MRNGMPAGQAGGPPVHPREPFTLDEPADGAVLVRPGHDAAAGLQGLMEAICG